MNLPSADSMRKARSVVAVYDAATGKLLTWTCGTRAYAAKLAARAFWQPVIIRRERLT